MPSNSIDRAVEKALEAKLAAHKSSTAEEIAADIKYMRMLAQTSEDDRVRFNATKYLIEHDWEVFEHENPATQKQEIEHKLPAVPMQLVVTVVDSKNASD